MLFRTRDLLVGQRTQLINALRGHIAEFGHVVAQGAANIRSIRGILEDETSTLPQLARELGFRYLDQIEQINVEVDALKQKIAKISSESRIARRLQTVPGVGPLSAIAIECFAPDMHCFRKGRDFAAWLGLVPRQHSSGGKQRLGRISRAGQRDIRRLLIIGAIAVIRWFGAKGQREDTWLARMLKQKPKKLVAVALATKMARRIWAMLVKGEDYREPEGQTNSLLQGSAMRCCAASRMGSLPPIPLCVRQLQISIVP